jgi:hydrogenase expression/formation protein HypC
MCLAVPVRITAMNDDQTARVTLNNVERTISLIMTPEARLGDYVLVHTGYAISVLDPEEAEDTLQLLDEMAGADLDVE